MSYLISEEAKDVRNFCEKEVVEVCKEADRTGEWPEDLYEMAKEQGYFALEVPEELGGPGLSRVDIAALFEEMAKADAGFATTISASGLGMKPVLIAGSEEQKNYVADVAMEGGLGAFCLTEPGAGSDASSGTTTAVKDGDEYVLNGRKCFITNGAVASYYCITASTDKSKGVKGLSMFLVPAGTPGLSSGKEEDKMGIRTSNTINENQAIQFKLADMDIQTEVARQMVANALTRMDMGLSYNRESAIAKCFASDIAMRVAEDAIQLFGGYGYSREYPVEKLLRDAKIFQIFEGTNEILRIVVANNLLRG